MESTTPCTPWSPPCTELVLVLLLVAVYAAYHLRTRAMKVATVARAPGRQLGFKPHISLRLTSTSWYRDKMTHLEKERVNSPLLYRNTILPQTRLSESVDIGWGRTTGSGVTSWLPIPASFLLPIFGGGLESPARITEESLLSTSSREPTRSLESLPK